MSKKTTRTKKLVKSRVRPDKSIEVELQKHPKDTARKNFVIFNYCDCCYSYCWFNNCNHPISKLTNMSFCSFLFKEAYQR